MSEMNRAKEVLSLFLSSAGAAGNTLSFNAAALAQPTAASPAISAAQASTLAPLPSDFMMSSVVSKPPPPTSAQAVDEMVSVGGKDEALRKAADIFRDAAHTVERSRLAGERYWSDALKLRRQNWALLPAPLPIGAPTGRSTDKTTKDFQVFYGLSESSPVFKRNAIARLPISELDKQPIVFQQETNVRLRISLITQDNGSVITSHSHRSAFSSKNSANDTLREAQRRMIEQEIFALLIRETGTLSYASSRVSERLIELEAAQDVHLRIELVHGDLFDPIDIYESNGPDSAECDLIYHVLFILFLHTHEHFKERRLAGKRQPHGPYIPHLLRPVIDVLQYYSFCQRIRTEMKKIVDALLTVGVPTKFHFHAVGGDCDELISSLCNIGQPPIGGDVTIRIDNSRSMRFTFKAPSTLTAHLSQATLSISSVPQLVQLLHDETEQCLLERICDIGSTLTEDMNGTWFVDTLMGRSVGKWEGYLFNFRISYGHDSAIHCSVSCLQRINGRTETATRSFLHDKGTLFEWLRHVILDSTARPNIGRD